MLSSKRGRGPFDEGSLDEDFLDKDPFGEGSFAVDFVGEDLVGSGLVEDDFFPEELGVFRVLPSRQSGLPVGMGDKTP